MFEKNKKTQSSNQNSNKKNNDSDKKKKKSEDIFNKKTGKNKKSGSSSLDNKGKLQKDIEKAKNIFDKQAKKGEKGKGGSIGQSSQSQQPKKTSQNQSDTSSQTKPFNPPSTKQPDQDQTKSFSPPSQSQQKTNQPQGSAKKVSPQKSSQAPTQSKGNQPSVRGGKQEPAVETPEMAKKEMIEKAREAGASNKEKIHTMPDKYKKLKSNVPSKGGKKKFLILGILIFILVAGVGAGYFFWYKPSQISPQPVVNENKATNQEQVNEEETNKEQTNQETDEKGEEKEDKEDQDITNTNQEQDVTNESKEEQVSKAKAIDVEVQDNEENIVSSASINFPEGSLPINTEINFSGQYITDEMRNKDEYKDSSYKMLGGLYKLSKTDVILKKNVSLEIKYHEDTVEKQWESDIKLAYFKDGMWTPLPAELDTQVNSLKVELGVLPSDTFSIVVNKEKLEEEQVSKAKAIDVEVQDNEENIVSSASINFPEGSLPINTEINFSGQYITDEMRNKDEYKDSSYKMLGGLYKLSKTDVILKKNVSLEIKYHEDTVEKQWESDIKLAYFKDGMWTPLPAELDTQVNSLKVELGVLPSDTFSIVVHKDHLTPGEEKFNIIPATPSSSDSDSDGLTDMEESLFATQKNNPDTDADQTPDGQEVVTLKDPNSNETSAKLTTTGLLDVYTNPTFSYSLFYPADWLARALPDTNNEEVLIITNTGEFFSITVENNPEILSPEEWYLNQGSLSNGSKLVETTVNNQPAVWNPNHSTIYIARDNKIYAVSYKVGTEKNANFKSTFKMIIKGFQFVTQPEGRPDGTLIKYPDEPGVYLIDDGQKRPFKSGEIFKQLGFKWGDVIEIPLSEEYPTGEVITGRLDGTLIKYPNESGVYLIENSKKRPFKSGEVFKQLGYSWEDVIQIPKDEHYPTGAVIDSHVTSTPPTL